MLKVMLVNVAMDVGHLRGTDGSISTELLFQDPQSGIIVGIAMDSGGVAALKLMLDGKKPIEIVPAGAVPPLKL